MTDGASYNKTGYYSEFSIDGVPGFGWRILCKTTVRIVYNIFGVLIAAQPFFCLLAVTQINQY